MIRSTIVLCTAAMLGGCVVLPLDYAYRDYDYRDRGYRDYGYRDGDRDYRDRGYRHRHDWGDRDRGDLRWRDDDRR
ncbi:hypothetical protein [Thauera sp. 2A1]|uniref:hypothetical protein n=1 Tax=Thauera sp. 2A1 TaxID=2570191 RepID=UPI0018853043|nr:hypothetical protein [Thauera sp. 2A1]KAI5915196.1 hypothetical protein GH664_08525 [Thauera sp. 2A1]